MKCASGHIFKVTYFIFLIECLWEIKSCCLIFYSNTDKSLPNFCSIKTGNRHAPCLSPTIPSTALYLICQNAWARICGFCEWVHLRVAKAANVRRPLLYPLDRMGRLHKTRIYVFRMVIFHMPIDGIPVIVFDSGRFSPIEINDCGRVTDTCV